MVDKPPRSEKHPTMKPVTLVAAMIGNSLPKRGIVYDPFGGSGSTLMAAHQLGCRARLVEIDCRHADVIVRRWSDFTNAKPERILPDGSTEPADFT
jgi:DNA modification methylase